MYKKYIIVFFLIISFWQAFAQIPNNNSVAIPDSLQMLLIKSKNNSDSVKAYLKISDFYRLHSIEKRLEFAQKAEQVFSGEDNDLSARIKLYLAKGHINYNHLDTARYFLNSAKKHFKNKKTKIGKRYLLEIMDLLAYVNFREGKIEKAIEKYEEAKAKAIFFNDSSGITINIYISLGNVYAQADNIDAALKNIFKAEQLIYKFKGSIKEASGLYNRAAYFYRFWGIELRAVKVYKKGLSFFEKRKDMKTVASIYNDLGIIYSNRKKSVQAVKFYREFLKYSQKSKDSINIALAYNNIGYEYSLINQYDSAEINLTQSLKITKKIKDTLSIPNTYHSLGVMYLKSERLEEAISYFNLAQKAYNALKGYEDIELECFLKKDRGIYYKNKSDFAKAENELNEALKLAVENNYTYVRIEIMEEISEIFTIKNKYKKAIEIENKISVLENKIYTDNISNLLSEVDIDYKVKKLEKQIAQLEEKTMLQDKIVANEKKTNLVLLIAVLIFFALVIAFAFVRRLNRKYRKTLKENNWRLTKNKVELEEVNENLKEVNIAKDRFFNLIALSLKKPFISLLDFSEEIIHNYDKLKNEELSRLHNSINITAQNLFELLENLLYWSRLEIGSIQMQKTSISINELIDENLNWFKNKLYLKEVILKTDFSADLRLNLDKNLMSLALRNLLSNSIEQTNRKGLVEISTIKHFDWVEVSIEDNSSGVSAEELKEILTVKQIGENPVTGLSLILSNKILQMHSGKLLIMNKKNIGTRISFRLRAN